MSTREELIGNIRNVVVKLGTQLLTDSQGRLDTAFIEKMAAQVALLRKQKLNVTIVSSGAIGCGLRELGLTERPTDLGKLQAVAAVGQRRLMDTWADAFEPYKSPVAQILLTREDIDDRNRFLNLRNTIAAVHEMNAIPIINENDTVSTAELVKITFGDNDILAALVTHALCADLLVLLTVVDGLLGPDNLPVRLVTDLEDGRSLVRREKSSLGRGGMESKLKAAQMVTEAGDFMVVANGRMENVLVKLIGGEEVGTLFLPAKSKKRSSRSRWIGSVRTSGAIVVDDGAQVALSQKNSSLLPAGIVRIDGEFAKGDVVAIQSPAGKLIARGLTNYSSIEMERIKGLKTRQVRQLLAEAAYDEVVHRDNLVLESSLT